MNLTITKYTIAIILVLVLGGAIGYGLGYLKYHSDPVPVRPPVYITDTVKIPTVTHVPLPAVHDTIFIERGTAIEQYYTAYTEDVIYEDTISVTYLSPTPLDTLGNDYFSITVKPRPEIRDTIKLTQIEFVTPDCPDQFKTITYSAGVGILVGTILTILLLR
jgi:hypothetical protein